MEKKVKQSELEQRIKKAIADSNYNSLTVENRKEYLQTEDGMQLIEDMARCNMNEIEMAHDLKMSQIEFKAFCGDFPLFADRIDYGRVMILKDLENALIRSAVGYETVETHRQVRTINGREIVNEDTYTKTIPPNPMSNQYALNNLRKIKYQQKIETSPMSDIAGIKITFDFEGSAEKPDCPIPE